MKIENEHTLRQAITQKINLFVGAGFSVLAKNCEGRLLPVSPQLVAELVAAFNIPNAASLDLSKISTILEHNRKTEFYSYIEKRFAVKEFDLKYLVLDKIDIATIFTTNVDDLIHKIYTHSSEHYLNDINFRGPTFNDREAIDFVALHGSILDKCRSMSFSSIAVAAAFRSDPDSWHRLTNQLEKYPTIFWGHSIEDAAVLEALHPSTVQGRPHKDRWIILMPSTDEGTIDFYKALDFQIILADTTQMLEYLSQILPTKSSSAVLKTLTRDIFPQESIPDIGQVPVRPIIDFYLGAAPSWNDVFSGRLYRTSHFAKIQNSINSGKHTIVIGLPASGKTTIMMQIAAEISFSGHKLMCDLLTIEKAHLMLTKLNGEKALIFIDNFTDSVDAFDFLSKQQNVQLVGSDRDYKLEVVSHKINKRLCQILDVTELSSHDIQEIFSRIPLEIKKSIYELPKISEGVCPSLFEVIEANIKKNTLRSRFSTVLHELGKQNINLLELLLVCCYVHKCRTPVSIDMLMAFFRDLACDYKEIYRMSESLGAMITDYAGELADGEQDYFIPRSIVVAEAVIEQAPPMALKRVLLRFHKEVSPHRIHRFDIFRRLAFDADLIRIAFPRWEEGLEFFETICGRDTSPFLRQQCALYLFKKNKLTEAFKWIDEAIMLSAGKIPSIRNSHAVILFKANIGRPETDGTVQRTIRQSMEILSECYNYDRRKAYHARVFAEQALRYNEVYSDASASEYLSTANRWLKDELRKSPWDWKIKSLLAVVSTKLGC